jgi:hypothetical protein
VNTKVIARNKQRERRAVRTFVRERCICATCGALTLLHSSEYPCGAEVTARCQKCGSEWVLRVERLF